MSVPFNTICVSVNQLMEEDVDYGLYGGQALCQCSAPNDKLHVESLDQSNAFTYIETLAHWLRV